MRTATLVLAAYALCVIVGACWRLLPAGILRDAVPELGALTAAYLGLTARRGLAPAVGGSVVIGYLADVISGTPVGLGAFVLGVTCLVTRGAQQRILVRGAVENGSPSPSCRRATSIAVNRRVKSEVVVRLSKLALLRTPVTRGPVGF